MNNGFNVVVHYPVINIPQMDGSTFVSGGDKVVSFVYEKYAKELIEVMRKHGVKAEMI